MPTFSPTKGTNGMNDTDSLSLIPSVNLTFSIPSYLSLETVKRYGRYTVETDTLVSTALSCHTIAMSSPQSQINRNMTGTNYLDGHLLVNHGQQPLP